MLSSPAVIGPRLRVPLQEPAAPQEGSPASTFIQGPRRAVNRAEARLAPSIVFGFVIGVLMGVTFAVLGAGGGIIAVPVLLLLFSLPLGQATGAGLGIVFAAALTSAVGHARAKRVDWATLAMLGPTSMVGAVLGARLNPLLPERATAGLFSVVLLAATVSLFRKKPEGAGAARRWVLLGVGLALGVLTGLLGVGGGFLLVPMLVGLARLPLHRAVGTSAALIALSSLAGGATALLATPALLPLVLPLAAGAVLGAVVGVPLSGRLPERALRVGFAVLSSIVAIGMAFKALVP